MPNAKDVKIDDGDLRILRILQEDGRITNQDLRTPGIKRIT